MNPEVFRRLRSLAEISGREYGKLVQKLLAIAFLDAGAESLTERSTQGIDLEVTLEGVAYALEVKTTEHGDIRLGRKDLDGLAARELGGARPFLAVLGHRLVDGWAFAHYQADELKASRTYSITALRPYRDRALEDRVARAFEAAVLEHASGAAGRGQRALDEVLAGYEGYRLA